MYYMYVRMYVYVMIRIICCNHDDKEILMSLMQQHNYYVPEVGICVYIKYIVTCTVYIMQK